MNEKCKICGFNTRKFYDNQFDISYYHCGKCDFISMDEDAIIHPREEKDKYDEHENTYENEGYVNYLRDFLDRSVVNYVNDGKNALDFGSGPGPVLARLLREEYGYDVDIYDLFYAPKKVYEGKKYDLVTSTEVVEHLKEPMEYFKLFKSLLKDDGLLALMTLFHPKDDEEFCKWHYRRDPTHISFFTPVTMEYIAKTLGFKIRYIDDKRCTSFSLK